MEEARETARDSGGARCNNGGAMSFLRRLGEALGMPPAERFSVANMQVSAFALHAPTRCITRTW